MQNLTDRERLLKAVLFRANYRGGKEADMILGAFAKQQAPSLDDETLAQFATLLTHDDHEIFAWMEGVKSLPSFLSADLITQLNLYKNESVKNKW